METKRITVTVGRKVSDGEYGSYHVELSEEVELEKGDISVEIKKKLRASLRKSVNAGLKEMGASL